MLLSIKIADIVLRVESDVEFKRFKDYGYYKDFVVEDDPPCDCRLDHRIGPPPDLTLDADPFFTQNWQLAASGVENILRIGPAPKKGLPDNLVVFNRDYSRGSMYQKSVIELFRRFIDQFSVINLLSRGNGFLLHSSGVIWEGKGVCFAGLSGTGKSTLLNLFKDEVPRRNLLNDDRLALRSYGEKWRVFGTPWYGESRVSSSNSADLAAIFFIRHARQNSVRRLSASEVVSHLMVLSLLPLWDQEAVSRVLDTFQNLIRNVPAYELSFTPDKSALDLIKKTI